MPKDRISISIEKSILEDYRNLVFLKTGLHKGDLSSSIEQMMIEKLRLNSLQQKRLP